jgi:hypothetical protein
MGRLKRLNFYNLYYFSRVQPQLHYKDIENIKPLGWATEGLWLPNHVNDGFLFSRYAFPEKKIIRTPIV